MFKIIVPLCSKLSLSLSGKISQTSPLHRRLGSLWIVRHSNDRSQWGDDEIDEQETTRSKETRPSHCFTGFLLSPQKTEVHQTEATKLFWTLTDLPTNSLPCSRPEVAQWPGLQPASTTKRYLRSSELCQLLLQGPQAHTGPNTHLRSIEKDVTHSDNGGPGVGAWGRGDREGLLHQ